MTDPELLLLDEPAAGLDLGGREDLVSTLSVLALDADSPATVLVSHHVEEIPPGFTHALLLREGRVVASGPLERRGHRGAPVGDLRDAAAAAATRTAATRARRRTRRQPVSHRTSDRVAPWTGSATTLGDAGSALAIVLGVAELFSLDLILLMLAVGALVGMVLPPSSACPSPSRSWSPRSRPSRMLALVRPSARQAPAHRPRAAARATASWSARRAWSPRDHRAAARPDQARRRGLDRRAVRRAPDASRRARRSRCFEIRARRPTSTRSRDSSPDRLDAATDEESRLMTVALVLLVAGPVPVRRRAARQDGADRPAGARRHRRALRQVQGDPARRPQHRDAVHRQGALPDRPARAGRVVPAAAGDHRGQPGRLDRHRHLLPGDRPGRGDLRDRQLHPGRRAAHHDHAAQHRRWHGPRADADQPRRDQQPACAACSTRPPASGASGSTGSSSRASTRRRRSRTRWRSRCAPTATSAPSILTAEGQRQSAILTAEGNKQSAILNAEGDRESQILRAQADREAAILRAQGEGQAIQTVFQAIHDGQPDQSLLAYQYLQMMPKIAEGDANKVWIVPVARSARRSRASARR